MTRVGTSDCWVSIIEADIDDPEVAQSLIDDLGHAVGALKHLVSHWNLKDPPE